MITYTTVSKQQELEQILGLQKQNVEKVLDQDEVKSQGFVTVHHDLPLLEAMNTPYPHIIAKDGDQVVGYTLVMLRSFKDQVPVLISMFDQINAINYEGQLLKDSSYFIMGQVCIDKAYRGQGLFVRLYHKMRDVMANQFDYIITEVADRNTRSIAAHAKVGFKNIKSYTSEKGEDWAILLWDWK